MEDRKQRLRHCMRQRLESLGPAAAQQAGEAIAEHLSGWSGWQEASAVALFSTLNGEVDSASLIRLARRAGKRMLFPRMVAGHSLEFAHVENTESLRRGRYGVLEPEPSLPPQALTSDAVVLIPGIAFDREGGRLGRGAGYYDRAFAVADTKHDRPSLVGIGFALQIIELVPVGSSDVRMDRVVTEKGFCPVA